MLCAARRLLPVIHMPVQHPLVAIIGATGTGKSQLAVSLAKQFDGEIINGDALQMYEGLPIITNKLKLEERGNIEHHLLGCIKLEEEPWTVKHFIERACNTIEDIRSRDKVPILVGGTHYYMQSLLFRNAVVDDEPAHSTEEEQEKAWRILDADTGQILKELYRVDPNMALRWHPNDRRKIRRSLEIYLTTGEKASDLYKQQQQFRACERKTESPKFVVEDNTRHATEANSPLRYNTLIFWVHAAPDALNARLEKRVDTMVLRGLCEEACSMRNFLQCQRERGGSICQDRGIWTAIGFKELAPWISDERCSQNVKNDCIERTKVATRQYAKRQLRWIRLKLQRALTMAHSSQNMFLLDGSDLSQWSQLVETQASEILAAFLSGRAIPEPVSLSTAATENLVTKDAVILSAKFCETCNKTLMSDVEWSGHLRSKRHRNAVKPKIDWQNLYPKV